MIGTHRTASQHPLSVSAMRESVSTSVSIRIDRSGFPAPVEFHSRVEQNDQLESDGRKAGLWGGRKPATARSFMVNSPTYVDDLVLLIGTNPVQSFKSHSNAKIDDRS